MQIKDFRTMYLAELTEAASFEEMMANALPFLAQNVSTDRLRNAIDAHVQEAKSQKQDMETLLRKYSGEIEAHTDQSMQALVDESRKMAGMVPEGSLRDAAIIASIQRMKHYEVAVYGTLATYAECLGLQDDKNTLGAMLDREKHFDEALSEIAEEDVNPQAAH
jgi:ferritin-like metal-binding protein YciE